MLTVIIAVVAFFLGAAAEAAAIIRQVRSGRLVIDGRIYLCKDTGPVVRP